MSFWIVLLVVLFYSAKGLPLNNNVLASLGVIFAIFLFVLEGWQQTESKKSVVKMITSYNCNLAISTIPIMERNKIAAGRYLTDTYKNNFGFIYDVYGKPEFIKYQQVVYDMESYNAVLEIADAVTTEQIKSIDPKIESSKIMPLLKLLALARKIKTDFCS